MMYDCGKSGVLGFLGSIRLLNCEQGVKELRHCDDPSALIGTGCSMYLWSN